MSRQDPQIPPAGEEIHLPPGSLQPLMLTVGVTMILLGVTGMWMYSVLIAGAVIFFWTLILWIRDAVREYRSLDDHHGHDHADDAAGHGEPDANDPNVHAKPVGPSEL